MNPTLTLAILSLLAELTPMLQTIWKDLSDDDQKAIREAYRKTLDGFASAIADNDETTARMIAAKKDP